jgi:hypothetical protein
MLARSGARPAQSPVQELFLCPEVRQEVSAAGRYATPDIAAMNASLHTLSNLFAQLGLPSSTAAIDAFILSHRTLGNDVALYRAPFWTDAQSAFLKEEIIGDADWAVVIDELNSLLH